jgi:hypothetical protein
MDRTVTGVAFQAKPGEIDRKTSVFGLLAAAGETYGIFIFSSIS